jgi:hypothetical protein
MSATQFSWLFANGLREDHLAAHSPAGFLHNRKNGPEGSCPL